MNRPEKILIVEDELIIAEYISQLLIKQGFTNIRMVVSAELAVEEIQRDRPDLVFSDITLKGKMTGIDLGNLLQEKYHVPFIYITSHATMDMVKLAGKTLPYGYLIKPIKAQDVNVAAELALLSASGKETTDNKHLVIKDGYGLVRISHNDIICLKADKNYTEIQVMGQRAKVVRFLMSEVQHMLPADQFIRIHKSYVINRTLVSKVSYSEVIANKAVFPLGRAYRQHLLDVLKA